MDKQTIKELRAELKKYLNTLDSEDKDEWYDTEYQFANDEIEKFLAFLTEKIELKEAY